MSVWKCLYKAAAPCWKNDNKSEIMLIVQKEIAGKSFCVVRVELACRSRTDGRHAEFMFLSL